MGQDNQNNDLVIERYLREQLSPEEAAAFEEAYLGSGELLDQLESAELLEQGLRDIAALGKSTEKRKQPGWMPSLFRSPQYAMAASFFLVVSLGVTGLMYQRLNDPADPGGFTATPAQIVPLVTVRGGPNSEPVNNIRLGPESPSLVLMLDPGFENYSHYRATVFAMDEAGSKASIMQVDGLKPGYEDMLALNVPASLMNPGDFEIQVEGWREEWAPGHDFDSVSVLTLRVLPVD